MGKALRLVSWNVNGLRACAKRGFASWLAATRPDIAGMQEVRARPEQLPDDVRSPGGYPSAHFVAAERPGYSGVGLLSRLPVDDIQTSLGRQTFDREGRLQIARIGRLVVANVYFPNGSGQDRDNGRVRYKLAFYRALFDRLERERAQGTPMVVMGDFNTAHREIDLARPKQNGKTSGFLPSERKELSRWLAGGWTDTFRHFESGSGHYSWWSQRFGVRERNVGWRIDYVLASPGAMPFVRGAGIHPEVQGSDHCPVSLELDPAVLRT